MTYRVDTHRVLSRAIDVASRHAWRRLWEHRDDEPPPDMTADRVAEIMVEEAMAQIVEWGTVLPETGEETEAPTCCGQGSNEDRDGGTEAAADTRPTETHGGADR